MKRVVVLIATLLAASSCSPIDMMSKQVAPYFAKWDGQPHRLEQIADKVYLFDTGLERSLILDTSEGLVVVDPFSQEFAAEMKSALAQRFPSKRISHLIYSHHHLDHTRGGAVLQPDRVWAHENTRWHFARYNTGAVLPPTEYLPAGDQDLVIGGVRVQLLDFVNAHAGHLWGVFLPDERIFYGTDLAFCRTLPPFGFPDWNYAGLVEALERTEATRFKTYIPSHFDRGDGQCVSEYKGLIVDARAAALRAFDRYGLPQNRAEWFSSVLKAMRSDLEPRYGDWHGWKAMHIPLLTRNLSGTYLGF